MILYLDKNNIDPKLQSQSMQKKVEDIMQAFQHYRFEDALRQIDQLMKKVAKDSKKKNVLSEYDNRNIHLIKCGSLASLGKIHEANQILQNYFTDKVLSEMTDRQKFLFCSMAELSYDEKIMDKVQLLNKTGKGDVRLQRFMLSHRLFSQVSKSFLKEYATGKQEEDGLAQIFLEYINELNRIQPIENYYSRDLQINPDSRLNLKMVELFFIKYFTGINLNKLQSAKLRASIVDLRIRLAINSNKPQDAKKYYLQGIEHIKENFVYLRSIMDMEQNQQENIRFYIQNCGSIFRRNLQIEKYVPLYDFYDEFLLFVLSEKITKNFGFVQAVLENEQELTEEQLYNFKEIPNEKILSHYYSSLQKQLKALTSGQKHQAAKKSDYYKISIKGLMLQILKIHHHVAQKVSPSQENVNNLLSNSSSFNSTLDAYFLQFSKTLTYPNEMKSYLPLLRNKFEAIFAEVTGQKDNFKLPNTFEKQDDNLILLTNAVKLLVVLNQDKLCNWKESEEWATVCWSLYQKFIAQVEGSKRREKGEVFLCDEFVSILADVIIFHIENLPELESVQTQSFIETALGKLMAILDQTTEVSPFNGYLKLRLIYVCQKLNYFDKLIDTYLSMDIKSVQFETLGYFLVNPLNSFNLYSQFDNHLTRMVRSYQENHRQTSQYCLKGLKAGTTHQVFEYLSYQKRLQKSFSKMMLFYTLYLNHQRKEHSEFYLNWIEKMLSQYKDSKKKISFNCDTKTMQNLIFNLAPGQSDTSQVSIYNEYYGHLNSPEVFEIQIRVRKIEALFRLAIETKSVENEKYVDTYLSEIQNKYSSLVKTTNLNELYTITNSFSVTEEYLSKSASSVSTNQNKQTFTLYKIQKDLFFYLKLTELKISLFNALKNTLSLLQLSEANQALVNQAKENFNLVFRNIEDSIRQINEKMPWRLQVKNCWMLRQTLFTLTHLSKIVNEEAGKLKKLPKPIKTLISNFSNELQKVVLSNVTTIKFAESLKTDPQVLNLQIEKKYLEKIQERDEMLRRTCSMDIKQAKNYLLG